MKAGPRLGERGHRALGWAIVSILATVPGGALAQVRGDVPLQAASDPGQLQRQLQEVQARLQQVDAQLEGLKRRRKGLLVDLKGLSLRRDRAQAEADGAQVRRDAAQQEVRRISQDQAQLRDELEHLRKDLRRQVRWMQALGPLGDLGLLGSDSDTERELAKGRYLAWWRLQERKRLAQVKVIQGDLDRREAELHGVLTHLAQEEQSLAQLQASLRVGEEQLQRFLEGLGQDEGRQKAMQAELAEEALQLERMLAGLLGRQPKAESFEASGSFVALRGELPLPVDGVLAESFGDHLHPKYHTRTSRNGILIEAAPGAPVLAVADGRVVFAETYQSYGPMVILDHGGGWFSLYTHLQAQRVQKGQVLRQGDLLGTVGEALDGPRLGFEIRQQSKPEDPQKWFKRRYR